MVSETKKNENYFKKYKKFLANEAIKQDFLAICLYNISINIILEECLVNFRKEMKG
jgi:hypothetical protein